MSDALDRLTPRRLLQVSIAVALLTIVLKAAAWWLTGSVGLLSDALEALVNLAGASFGLLMVTIAARPPDDDHPFGHHKAEYFSSGFEGVLIVVAGLAIVWAALHRLLEPQPLQRINVGVVLTLLSAALNAALAVVMLRASRTHRSVALEGDARHLFTDVWTSIGVVVGIVLVGFTGWLWLDPVLAIAVALHILREGARLVWLAAKGLMDEALDPELQADIERVLGRFAQPVDGSSPTLRFDHIATRKAGQRRFVDLHMHLPAAWTLGRAAALRAEVERALMGAVPGLRASIQLLPMNREALSVEQAEEEDK